MIIGKFVVAANKFYPIGQIHMVSAVFKTTILFLFWVLISGTLEPFFVLAGLASAIIITFINGRYSNISVRALFFLIIGTLSYGCWLMYRIWTAAFHVAKLAFHPQMPISPRLFSHSTFLESDTEKVIFANSITLTPGTVAVDLNGQELTIHQLDEASADDIVSRAMETEIARIRKKIRGSE